MAMLAVIQSSHGSRVFIRTIPATSRRELSRMVKEENPGHIPTHSDFDCTGKLCAQYAKLLRAYRDDNGAWSGLVEITQSFDV